MENKESYFIFTVLGLIEAIYESGKPPVFEGDKEAIELFKLICNDTTVESGRTLEFPPSAEHLTHEIAQRLRVRKCF